MPAKRQTLPVGQYTKIGPDEDSEITFGPRSNAYETSKREMSGNGVGSGCYSYTPHEEGCEERDVYMDEFECTSGEFIAGAENRSVIQSKFISRISTWHNEVEERAKSADEEEGCKMLTNDDIDQCKNEIRNSPSRRINFSAKKLFLPCAILFLIGFVVLIVVAVKHFASTPSYTNPDDMSLTLKQKLKGQNSFGTTVAMEADWLALGSPRVNTGLVVSMRKVGFTWNFLPDLTGTDNSAFGAGLAITKPQNDSVAFMLVGAPGGGDGNEGQAMFFMFDPAADKWEQQGAPLVGNPTTSTTPERFGTSVAVSENLCAVVGAPGNDSNGQLSGSIYTFSFQLVNGMYEAVPISRDTQLFGFRANGRFGADVDITRDGSFIVAGEPGSNSFSIFSWDGSQWLKIFEQIITEEPHLGTSVKFLSSKYVAIGAPDGDNYRGAVLVFERNESNNTLWTMMPALRGEVQGDRLGAFNTVSGQIGPLGPELVVGTSHGEVRRYDFIKGNWVLRYSENGVVPVTAVASYSMGNNQTVLVGHGSTNEGAMFSTA